MKPEVIELSILKPKLEDTILDTMRRIVYEFERLYTSKKRSDRFDHIISVYLNSKDSIEYRTYLHDNQRTKAEYIPKELASLYKKKFNIGDFICYFRGWPVYESQESYFLLKSGKIIKIK